MTNSGGDSPEKRSGCGLLNAVFGSKWMRRTTSTGSLPNASNNNNNNVQRTPSTPSRRRRSGSNENMGFDSSNNSGDRIISRPGPNHAKARQNVYNQQPQVPPIVRTAPTNQGYGQAKKVPQGTIGISGELESMITDHQKVKGHNGLVRASSGNVMLYGNLGNLKQPGTNNNSNSNVINSNVTNGKYSNTTVGNVVKKQEGMSDKPTSLCRALSTRMDPEQLKIMGNEDYKNGRFEEALALYDAAISIDPDKASYRSNKSAALTALGRLLEAVFECREAIKIEPYYQRAHNRLATLNLRLGEAEKAIYHFKYAGAEADPDVLTKAKDVQAHLNKCTETKRQHDWNGLLRESGCAISAGADTAPLIFGLQAEALLKMNRLQEADEALSKGPNFDADEMVKFFGPIGQASLLVIRAQVDMAAGRFEEAVAAAQSATRLDVNNKEATMVSRKTRAVASARSRGNELFKAGRHSEACVAYGEGLDYDPYNAVLLCNRAACRSKLEQFEKAVEDCNAALKVRPSYSKARLRRADCNAKLGRLEASRQDYEVLLKENPDDEGVRKAMDEVLAKLKRRGGESREMNAVINNKIVGGAQVVAISSDEHFRDCLMSPGVSVVLFCDETEAVDDQMMQFLDQLMNRYQALNFFKMNVDEHPILAKSEGVGMVPSFKIYKQGSRPKQISGDNRDLLESSIKFFIS